MSRHSRWFQVSVLIVVTALSWCQPQTASAWFGRWQRGFYGAGFRPWCGPVFGPRVYGGWGGWYGGTRFAYSDSVYVGGPFGGLFSGAVSSYVINPWNGCGVRGYGWNGCGVRGYGWNGCGWVGATVGMVAIPTAMAAGAINRSSCRPIPVLLVPSMDRRECCHTWDCPRVCLPECLLVELFRHRLHNWRWEERHRPLPQRQLRSAQATVLPDCGLPGSWPSATGTCGRPSTIPPNSHRRLMPTGGLPPSRPTRQTRSCGRRSC